MHANTTIKNFVRGYLWSLVHYALWASYPYILAVELLLISICQLRRHRPPPWSRLADVDGETFGDDAGQNAGDPLNDHLPDFFGKGTSGDQEFSR